MRLKILSYIFPFVLMLVLTFLFTRSYMSMTNYTAWLTRHTKVLAEFQEVSRSLRNAAVINSGLEGKDQSSFFYSDTNSIRQHLDELKTITRDSTNQRLSIELDAVVSPIISWIYNSDIPDSILKGRSQEKINRLIEADSIIKQGVRRTDSLISLRHQQLAASNIRTRNIMILFVVIVTILLGLITYRLVREKTRSEGKDKELATLFERVSDGVFSLDNQWRFTFLNAAAANSGYKGERIGKKIWDVHPELKDTIFWEKYHEAASTRQLVEFETFYGANQTWLELKVYPSASGITVFFKDITAKKEAEKQLGIFQQELADYKFAIDESSIVAITDQKGIIKHANDNFCKISKYSREELIGQDHRIISSGYHSKEFIANLWRTIAHGRIWKGQLRNKAKDGSIYWVDTTIVPFVDKNGKPFQYLAIRADITDRKSVEQELVELNAALESKISRRTEELQKLNQELEAFTYSVSHDLRAPLRGILGFTSILEDEYASKLDDEAKRITSIIRNSTLKMGRLIDDLLTFSRTGKKSLNQQLVNMQQLVTEVKNDLLLQQQINAEWKIETLLPSYADVNLIRQVWVNLLSNAVKYSRNSPHPLIETGSYEADGFIIYYVKDNGVGFDQEYRDKLFKVFQRLHDADEFEGTGVGLALVEKIVTKHGGKVWATGEKGRGATFSFSLKKEMD